MIRDKLFRRSAPHELTCLVPLSPAQDEILAEGDFSHELCILIEGRARVIGRAAAGDISVAAGAENSRRGINNSSFFASSRISRASLDHSMIGYDASKAGSILSSSGGPGEGLWRSKLLGPGDVFGEISFFTETPALEVSGQASPHSQRGKLIRTTTRPKSFLTALLRLGRSQTLTTIYAPSLTPSPPS